MNLYNRRDFLKIAGGAGAGLIAGPLLSASRLTRVYAAGGMDVAVQGCFLMATEPGLITVRALSLEPAIRLKSDAFPDRRAKIKILNVPASRLDVKCDRLENAAPGETEIVLDVALPAAGAVEIKTAFRPKPGERLNFIAFSDTHLGPPEAEAHFARIVKHTNLRMPLFAVNAGDNVDVDEPAQWKVFMERTAALKMPLFTTIGNHDSYFSTKLYRKNLGDLFYGFKAFDARFLFLDNSQKHNNATLYMDGSAAAAQWDWMEKQLREPAKHRFVFFHFPIEGVRGMTEPMYMVGTPPDKRKSEVERMKKLFRETGVDYFCFGHIHSPERTAADGIVSLRLGGAGGSKSSSTDDRSVSFAHFFADEKGIRDYTVFLYYRPDEIERLEFCEPRGALPAGAREPIVVHGVAKGRLLGVEASLGIASGPGRMENNVFIAEKPGKTAVEARFEGHKATHTIEVA